MPLTILSDHDVNHILHSFTKKDILDLQETLADALHWYSTSADANDCCSDYQPERTTVKRRDGSSTLFMPASSNAGQGIKVINVSAPDVSKNLPKLMESFSISSSDSRGSSISSESTGTSHGTRQSSITTTTTASSLPSKVNSTDEESGYLSPTSGEKTQNVSSVRGSLTLMDCQGNTTGLINAEEITAFRTALASTMLLKKRHHVHDLTCFGAGKSGYWHIRLALLLRGSEIHHVNLISRNFDSARACLMRLYNPLPDDPKYENPIGQKYNSKTKATILTPAHTEYERLLKEYVRAAHVIFTTTPSTIPLFPATYLTNPEGRKKGRLIAAVGSHRPDMIELHPDILRYAVAPHHEHRHLHKRQKEGGAIVVDTVTGCLKDAGEVVQAKLMPDQVVELGELFMLKRDAEARMKEKHGHLGVGHHVDKETEGGCNLQDNSGLKEWLTKGNVIYKSVGLGLMDVVVGNELVRIARQRGIGTTIERF